MLGADGRRLAGQLRQRLLGVVTGVHRPAVGGEVDVTNTDAFGHGELVLQPLVVAGADHQVDVRRGRAEGRLLEEVRGGRPAHALPGGNGRVPDQHSGGQKCKGRQPCARVRDRSRRPDPA